MVDAIEMWKLFRKFIPLDKRYEIFCKFIYLLEDSGWDQGGYLHDWPVSWNEVHQYDKDVNGE